MTDELISVMVPLYNVATYLPKCLDSILIQTYSNIEILLVDDGSTDSSGIICDNYASKDSRVKVFHKKNEGPVLARNEGLMRSTCEYIAYVDAESGTVGLYYIDAFEGSKVIDIKPYTPSIDRIEHPITPDWCAHWPKCYEESSDFNWGAEFNF